MMSINKFSTHRPRTFCVSFLFVAFFDFNIISILDDLEVSEFRLHTENSYSSYRTTSWLLNLLTSMSEASDSCKSSQSAIIVSRIAQEDSFQRFLSKLMYS